MHKIKYRLNDPRLAPRRTKLEIPGLAGSRDPRKDGSYEQVWHCVPFSEGSDRHSAISAERKFPDALFTQRAWFRGLDH